MKMSSSGRSKKSKRDSKDLNASKKSVGCCEFLKTSDESLEECKDPKSFEESSGDFEELGTSGGSLRDFKDPKTSNGSLGNSEDPKTSNESIRGIRNRKTGYWEHMVNCYEKRNASLERRQAALMERMRFMECSLPSMLMGAVVTMKRGSEAAKLNPGSARHQGRTNRSSCNPSGTNSTTTDSRVK